jgi:5'-nucleotidase
MKILITNDDGFSSPALGVLCRNVTKNHEIFMVAPAREQSGVGQAITLHKSLAIESAAGFDYPAYKVSGTPSDCVKAAICHLFQEQKFDLVISGINPVENAGLSCLYSGTVAGAREGATWGIPSIALSVSEGSDDKIEYAAKWTCELLNNRSLFKFEPGVFWNINFPECAPEDISGVQVSHMSMAMFDDHYRETKTDDGNVEYILSGIKRKEQFDPGSDDHVIQNNKISITPLHINQTCLQEKERLLPLEKELLALQP